MIGSCHGCVSVCIGVSIGEFEIVGVGKEAAAHHPQAFEEGVAGISVVHVCSDWVCFIGVGCFNAVLLVLMGVGCESLSLTFHGCGVLIGVSSTISISIDISIDISIGIGVARSCGVSIFVRLSDEIWNWRMIVIAIRVTRIVLVEVRAGTRT